MWKQLEFSTGSRIIVDVNLSFIGVLAETNDKSKLQKHIVINCSIDVVFMLIFQRLYVK